MKTVKRLIAASAGAIALLSGVLAPQAARADDYDQYLRELQEGMSDLGARIDVFDRNPFQTGTALSQFYLNEKTLLLSRDAYFSLRANPLETTEEVADYQFRTRVLRAHANNMLLQLMQAIRARNEEGFLKLEAPKHAKDLETLVAQCAKDARCVADRLQNPETSLTNVLIDNFALASEVFRQLPYLQVLEVNSVYQLIQLMYLEAVHAQNQLSAVEFELFQDKQAGLARQIRRNPNLLAWERDFQLALATNLVDKFKRRVLERKIDQKREFERQAKELAARNAELLAQIDLLHADSPEIFRIDWRELPCVSRYQEFKRRVCLLPRRRRIDLRGQCAQVAAVEGRPDLIACVQTVLPDQKYQDELKTLVLSVRNEKPVFLGTREAELPSRFWEKL